jgi:hypothetical protein
MLQLIKKGYKPQEIKNKMAGVLTHVAVMFFGILISLLLFRKWSYGIFFALGQGMPDFLSFGITGLRYLKFTFLEIMKYGMFYEIGYLVHAYQLWLVIFLIVQAVILLAWAFEQIKKKTAIKLTMLNLVFFIGVLLHLFIDRTIFETNIWV